MNTAPYKSEPSGPPVEQPLSAFGIPSLCAGSGGTNVYMVLGRLFKIHPTFESLVFDVLERDECGVVALISERVGGWNEALWERMRDRHGERKEKGGRDVLERVR